MKEKIGRVVAWFMSWTIAKILNQVTEEMNAFGAVWRRAFLDALKEQNAIKKRRVYVTLRGTYLPSTRKEAEPHGWTEFADVTCDGIVSVTFEPWQPFAVERVEVLGAATIVDARIGNLSLLMSPFDKPAQVELKGTIEVGNRFTVTVKGWPADLW